MKEIRMSWETYLEEQEEEREHWYNSGYFSSLEDVIDWLQENRAIEDYLKHDEDEGMKEFCARRKGMMLEIEELIKNKKQ